MIVTTASRLRWPTAVGVFVDGVLVAVGAHDIWRGHDLAIDQIVRHVQHAADQRPGAGDACGLKRVAAALRRRALQDEAALCAYGHNYRVLDHLGLHQPQNFGTEILAPVRPADAAARNLAAAQVDAFHPGREHKNFRDRPR